MVNVSPSGLLTISGGKWTTYRAMAQDAIDKAVEIFSIYLKFKMSRFETIRTLCHRKFIVGWLT